MDKKIFTEVKDHIGIIWFNRPEKKNALNDELWFGLPDLVKELDDNDEVRVIVFAAKGDTFSSGIDINTLVNAFELTEEAKTTSGDRLEVMEIHTRGMPISKDVNLKVLSSELSGYTGADMKSLCREAAMRSIRRYFPEIDFPY